MKKFVKNGYQVVSISYFVSNPAMLFILEKN